MIDFDATDGARFHEILAEARAEPGVLAMWLSGSRGKGRATARSDYDLVIVVTEELLAAARGRWGCHADRATDCTVMSWAMFEANAAWGAPDAWNRYAYARVRTLLDRTGRAQALIDAKGRVPPGEVRAFVDASLDRYLNQTYRALKCHRDGLFAAARLEAADVVTPLLDALFALDDGRLRSRHARRRRGHVRSRWLRGRLRRVGRGAALDEGIVLMVAQRPQDARKLVVANRRRKTPEPMTMEEFALLDALEDQLLDWMEAGKGPWVAYRADHPNVPDVVWTELTRSARNTGLNVIASETMVVIAASEPE